jgi:thymidylate synthase (FAD)
MILMKPSFTIESCPHYLEALDMIENAGRTCYKSEDKKTKDSAEKMVKALVKRGHHSVIEHVNMTVRFICDRGVTHEIVRHRLAAYSQESTRYCNYKGGVAFIIPPWVNVEPGEYFGDSELWMTDPSAELSWMKSMFQAEQTYIELINNNWSPQQARSVLPNSLKTEIVMTANFREWRHILALRTSKACHPQMREVMIPLLEWMKREHPVFFEDITY